jgi:hypothetical protein
MPLDPLFQSYVAQLAVSHFFFNALFNPMDAAHHDPIRFLSLFRWLLDFNIAP